MDSDFTSGFALGESRNNNDNGWGNGMGIFGILALLGIANGGFGFGNNRAYGAEVAGTLAGNDALFSNALQTTQLEAAANQRQVCDEFANTNSNIVNGNYQTQNVVQGWGYNLTRDIGTAATALNANVNSVGNDLKDRMFSMSQQDADYFCTTLRGIDSVNYNSAINTEKINTVTMNGIQKVLDKLCEDKAERQAARIQQLELQQAMCGVLKFPNQWVYNAGKFPICCNGSY